jgi:tetratricopeptide (TPR) repeat protein
MLANYEILQDQNEKAIQRLTLFIEDGDKHIYYLMALAKMDSDPEESLGLMEKSLSTEFSMSAASRLQTYYQKINDTKNLVRINDQIEQFGGINIRTAKFLTKGYLFLKDYRKANKLVNILIEQGQTDAASELLGDILAHQGKYGEAVAIYNQVISSGVSEQLLLKFFTSRIKADDENVLAILGEADDMLVKSPEMYNLQKFIGRHYIDNDNKAAVGHLKTLVDKYPTDIVSLNNLAWASLDLDPGAALKYSTEAYRINSDNFNIIDTHIRALKKNNQITSARELLENKISQNPDNHQLKGLLDFLEQ